MKACGLDEARRIDAVPTASAAESANAAQQAFWHSGLNAAVVSRGNETATEGPGGCLNGRRRIGERTGICETCCSLPRSGRTAAVTRTVRVARLSHKATTVNEYVCLLLPRSVYYEGRAAVPAPPV